MQQGSSNLNQNNLRSLSFIHPSLLSINTSNVENDNTYIDQEIVNDVNRFLKSSLNSRSLINSLQLSMFLSSNQFPFNLLLKLSSLISLNLSFNNLNIFPSDFLNHFNSLKILNLNSNSIRSLPLEIIRLTNLNRLSLHKNLLDSFPYLELEYFINLSYLDLGSNRIESLSSQYIQKSSSLKTLKLDRNNILNLPTYSIEEAIPKSLPVSIFPSSLTVLSLAHNQLHIIPAYAFSRLNNLIILNLSYNNISLIDINGFANTGKIEHLFLNGNLLSGNLSSKIFNKLTFPFLKNLYLQDNSQIKSIPESLFEIDSLYLLKLDTSLNSKIEFPPLEVIIKSNDYVSSIKSYLYDEL